MAERPEADEGGEVVAGFRPSEAGDIEVSGTWREQEFMRAPPGTSCRFWQRKTVAAKPILGWHAERWGPGEEIPPSLSLSPPTLF